LLKLNHPNTESFRGNRGQGGTLATTGLQRWVSPSPLQNPTAHTAMVATVLRAISEHRDCTAFLKCPLERTGIHSFQYFPPIKKTV